MAKKISVIVENKLFREKRDMTVYHHFSKSSHMISADSSLTIPFRTAPGDDYLHISVVMGPGRLEENGVIMVPSWADFEFTFDGNVILTRSGDRTMLKLPPGIPAWQLKLTHSSSHSVAKPTDRITICDFQPGNE
ncbi:MAG: hypothetical protein GY757_19635 [bacterium]|nr:hypothetical protein [bacterium]